MSSQPRIEIRGQSPFKQSGVYEAQISLIDVKPSDDQIRGKTFSPLWKGNFHLRVKDGIFSEVVGDSKNPLPKSIDDVDVVWVVVNDLFSSLYSVFDVKLRKSSEPSSKSSIKKEKNEASNNNLKSKSTSKTTNPEKLARTLKAGNDKKFILVCGPSGVGKGTLIKELNNKYESLLGFSVSYTNRGPRPGEEDGVHYNFVTEEVFVQEIADNNFLEHVHFADKRYGTNKKFIDKIIADKKVCILDVEIKGAKMINDSDYKGITVFVKPPTFESLAERLKGRGTETEDVIAKRVEQARVDLEIFENDNFFNYTIVNDDLKTATNEILGIFEKEFLNL